MLECKVLVVLLGVSADDQGKNICMAGCIVLPDSNAGALVALLLVGSLQTYTGSWLVPETVVVVAVGMITSSVVAGTDDSLDVAATISLLGVAIV